MTFHNEQRDQGERRTAENNQVYGYALYKMAWVLYNLQDFEGSLNKFYEVIEYGRAHPNAGSVTALLRNARMELVTVYGSVYGTAARPLNVAYAFATFQRYAADEENSYTMFEKLAELYQDAGQWPNAVASYHAMMERRANSDRFCFWQAQVARAIIASRPKPVPLQETVDRGVPGDRLLAGRAMVGLLQDSELAPVGHRPACASRPRSSPRRRAGAWRASRPPRTTSRCPRAAA